MIFERIKKIADEKNISIAELERSAGLSNGAISKWRTVNPIAANLLTVANVLEVPVTVLLEDEERK